MSAQPVFWKSAVSFERACCVAGLCIRISVTSHATVSVTRVCVDDLCRMAIQPSYLNRSAPMSYPGIVIFDCDGVIVDSEVIDARIRSECFRTEGFPITVQELADHSGISRAGLIELVQSRFGGPLPEEFMEATRAKIMSAFTDELQAIEGVSELLRSLTMPVCVASNSYPDRLRHSLEVTGLWQFFDPH